MCYLIAALVLFGCSAVCASQIQGEIAIGGGIAIPMQPDIFTDYWNVGPALSGSGGVILDRRVGLNIGLSVSFHTLKDHDLLRDMGLLYSPVILTGGSFTRFAATAGVNVYMVPSDELVSPYLIGRFGYCRNDLETLTITVPGEGSVGVPFGGSNAFSLGCGLGLHINASRYLALYVEGAYERDMQDGDDTGAVPLRAGMKMKL